MAVIRWIGAATAVAQVDTFTPANVEIDDIFILTVTGLDGSSLVISFVATVGDVPNVTAGLTTAWNDSTNALASGITAADNTTDITLTADAAGTAFSVASTAVDGGGADTQTLSRAATTANTGVNNWDNVDNWSGGALPGGAADQDVYLGDAEIFYGLDQSAIGNALDTLNVESAKISVNPATGTLPTYLQIKAAAVLIGRHSGPGTIQFATPVNIDTGATASNIVVYNSGTNTTTTQPAVRLIAASASTNIEVRKGRVGIGYHNGETATVGNIVVNYITSQSSDADVYIGEGVTLTNYTQKGGACSLGSAIGTLGELSAGAMTTFGEGTIATMNISGGTATLNAIGTITALNVTGNGTADLTKSSQARTVTTAKIGDTGTIKVDPSVVTLTNNIQPFDATGDITLRAA